MGIAAVATGAIGWRRFKRLLCERLDAQSLLAASAATVIIATLTILAAQHYWHHAAHASAGDMALMSDPGTLPLCRGGAPGDRITDIASIEE
jgi:hypothetical protein